MSNSDFKKNYFELFDLPVQFALDSSAVGERFRSLQQQFHPDRFAGTSEQEQRIAVQYSALVNQAYTTLRNPLQRSLYLLELAGMTQEDVAAEKVDGGFLMEQLELREKLETINTMVDPETFLDHLLQEIAADIKSHQMEFEQAYKAQQIDVAAMACVKMQYLEKLLQEAEQIESTWLD
ncbi:MAG: Fe-S protein assembly co-chaperone HscB [Halioglobus sp.]